MTVPSEHQAGIDSSESLGEPPRIEPLPTSQWSPEMAEFVARLRSSVVDNSGEASQAAGTNIVGTVANHPQLGMAYLTFNAQLLTGNTLSDRQRELLILRVAHVRHSAYEWAQHALVATGIGITAQELQWVAEGPSSEGWSQLDRVLLTAADELIFDGVISADTWIGLVRDFDDKQAIDLVFTVGSYAMLGMALRSFAVQPEEALRPYLP